MRVAIDARDLNRVHLRGMGRYIFELVRRGAASGRVNWTLLTDRPDLPLHLPEVDRLNVETFEVRGHRFHAWEQLGLPRRVRRGVDLLHCPSMRAPWLQPVPTVVTIHDTIPWERDEPSWGRGVYTNHVTPAAYRKCAAVITVTHASAREIVRHWPDLEPRLHVILNGVADEYLTIRPGPLSPLLAGLGIREPYLLYFGGEIPRKRLDWALDVFAELRDTGLNFVVCGVTAEGRGKYLERLPAQLRSNLCFAPFVPEPELPRLYQNAVALLYPTLHEGFGLPALEAQAVGTPAVFSPVSSLPEVAGPGSYLVPVDDRTGWVSAVARLVNERRAGSAPRDDARAWSRQFSWAATAAKTIDVYESVLRETSGLTQMS